MKVIFGRNKKLGSLALQAYMGFRFSHVGVLIDNDTVLEAVYPEGVRLVSLDDFISRYTDTEIRKIYTNRINKSDSLSQLGKKYDVRGLLGLAFNKRAWNDPHGWFCSELVALYSGLFTSDYRGSVDVKDIYKVSHRI